MSRHRTCGDVLTPGAACCDRFMARKPDKWDYALAGVPSPLTDEMESQQMAKQVGCPQHATPNTIPCCTAGHLGTVARTAMVLPNELLHGASNRIMFPNSPSKTNVQSVQSFGVNSNMPLHILSGSLL